ncbi:MAG: aminotransferase class V-fold PLP-dependent enzyme [Longimicrobiales bacterium]|nr:aminotransferase class V-fold PLP-dependent enzyme [Longimicrobiales bacterium]
MTDSLGRRAFLSLSGSAVLLAASRTGLEAGVSSNGNFTSKAGDDDAEVFAAARREFLFPTEVAYCNTGTLGAMPRGVLDAQTNELRRLEAELPDWPYYTPIGAPLTGYQPREDIRADVGSFIGADMEEVALTQNATMSMNFLANGMTYSPGDEIIFTDQEHGGSFGPFRLMAKRYGAVVKEINLDTAVANGPEGVLEAFADAITRRTKVIMFSQITSGFGHRLPTKELCRLARDRGIFSIVDGAQVLGQMPVDVKDLGCDAYVSSPHKWLLAPKGTGILYIERSRQEELWATLGSYNYDNREDDAFRFMQYGTGSPALLFGLKAALDFNRELGVERIARWNNAMTTQLHEGLQEIPNTRIYTSTHPDMFGGATTFGLENKTADELQDALWEGKIRVRAQRNNRRVRLCAHLYVSPDDIARALDIVRTLEQA